MFLGIVSVYCIKAYIERMIERKGIHKNAEKDDGNKKEIRERERERERGRR